MDRRHAAPVQGFTAFRQCQPVGCRPACAQDCVVSFERDAGKLVQITHLEAKLKTPHQPVPHLADFLEMRSQDLQCPEHGLPDLGQEVTCGMFLHRWDSTESITDNKGWIRDDISSTFLSHDSPAIASEIESW